MEGLVIILLGAVSSVLASTPRVICTRSSPAELSGNVTLTCEFQADLEVLQITWQKKRGKDTQNMVTCSEKYGIHITEPFKKHITVLNTPLPKSCISITKLEKDDEACYNCLFNAYPNGAFTGEVCLTDLRSAHEVLCIGQGNDLRIDLNPQEIQTRTSVQLIEKKIGDFSTVKGQYSDPSINPTCEFWLEKESVEENQNNPPEDTFFTQCSASGNKRFNITWNNKGRPVSQEEKMNITGSLITVTSTLIHNVSSLPAGRRLKCTVKLIGEPLEAYPEKAALSAKEPTLGNFNKGDTEKKDQQQRPLTRYLMISFAGFLPLVIFSVILFYYKVWKKKEAKTPKKLVEKGPETPPSSIKKLVGVIKEWNSPKFSTENESGPARSQSPMNKGTPSNSDHRNPRENLESSVKKRNLRGSEKNTSSRRLQFISK